MTLEYHIRMCEFWHEKAIDAEPGTVEQIEAYKQMLIQNNKISEIRRKEL